MRLTLEHRTGYRYSAPVDLDPHVFRLHPRADAATRLVDFEMKIDPEPFVRSDNLDPEGNVITYAWFQGKTDHLTIETRAVVDTLLLDPFRFLMAEPDRALPYAYAPDFATRLEQFRQPPDAAHISVRELALEAAHASKRDQAVYPGVLARMIQEHFTVEVRHHGEPHAPEVTIAARRGACRDLAVLFVECCRAMGLAARFVSGYRYLEGMGAIPDLHAWGEVFLRGGGWRGYDPTEGLAVTDRHIPLAAAADSLAAAPVTGAFRGDGVTHTLEAHIQLTAGN